MNKGLKVIFTVVLLTCSLTAFSQVYFRNLVYNRKSVYLEVMGNGKYYSVNYEWLFHDYGIKHGVRGGAGVFPNFLNVNRPLCITGLAEYVGFWLSRYHHIEWGAGLTYRYESYTKTSTETGVTVTGAPAYDTVAYTTTHTLNSKLTGPIVVGRLGYRYQDPNGGLLIRAGWTPMFYLMNKEKLTYDGITTVTAMPFSMSFMSFGVSIGYNFW
jgi:hypothetical protein